MLPKTIVCRCEDVTLAEVEEAIADGMRDMESLKRWLAVGTGPCQGKNCTAIVARFLHEAGVPEEQIHPVVARPPLVPTPLAFFAGSEADAKEKPGEGPEPSGTVLKI